LAHSGLFTPDAGDGSFVAIVAWTQSKVLGAKLFAFVIIEFASQLGAETDLASAAGILRVPASRFQNQSSEQLSVDLRRGIGPDEASAIALYSNPALRAIRDRRGLAAAQLVQAGILQNPVVSYSRDYVTGGNTAETTTGYNFSAGWELSSLIPFLPKQTQLEKISAQWI